MSDLSTFPPERVVVDTSAVLCALMEDQANHAEYADFFARAVEAGATIVYCELLNLALAEGCIGIALRRRHGRGWANHRRDGRALRPARRLMEQLLSRWQDVLDQATAARIPLASLHDAPRQLMLSTPLRSYDAAHAATALATGSALLCRDVGFADLPRPPIITDAGRARSCRRRRGGRVRGESAPPP